MIYDWSSAPYHATSHPWISTVRLYDEIVQERESWSAICRGSFHNKLHDGATGSKATVLLARLEPICWIPCTLPMQIVYQFHSTSTEYCSRDDSLRSQARTLANFARFLLDMLKEKPEPTFFRCSDSVGPSGGGREHVCATRATAGKEGGREGQSFAEFNASSYQS